MAVAKATPSSATTTTTTTGGAVSTPNLSKQEENDPHPNPILLFFTNLLKNFKLPPLPFLPPKKQQVVDERAAATSDGGRSKSGGVSYPSRDLSSGKLDVVRVRESNPFVAWQGYAIGGIIVLRWAWLAWNKARKPPGDSPAPASASAPAPSPATATAPADVD